MAQARRPKIIHPLTAGQQRKPWNMIRRLIRCIAFLPLVFLLLERALFSPFDADFDNTHLSGYLPVETAATKTRTKSKREEGPASSITAAKSLTKKDTRTSLQSLTQPFRVTDTSSVYCRANGTKSILGYHHLDDAKNGTRNDLNTMDDETSGIPKILHRQGPKRCVPLPLYKLHEEWKSKFVEVSDHEIKRKDQWSVYFHTEDAMTRLFRAVVAVPQPDPRETLVVRSIVLGNEFPHLGPILKNCVQNGSLGKRILWRFLCLYVFGGVFVDLEYKPTDDLIQKIKDGIENDDALLFARLGENFQSSTNTASERIIDPNIQAVSPRHPLMYFAVQHALLMITTDEMPEDAHSGGDRRTFERIVSKVLERSLIDFFGNKHNRQEQKDDGILLSSALDKRTVSVRAITGAKSGLDANALESILKRKSHSPTDGVTDNSRSIERPSEMSTCLVKMLMDASTPR